MDSYSESCHVNALLFEALFGNVRGLPGVAQHTPEHVCQAKVMRPEKT
mgnify:FL=1